jgi:hypothetical protein
VLRCFPTANGTTNGTTNGTANGTANGSANGKTIGLSHGPTNGSAHGPANGSANDAITYHHDTNKCYDAPLFHGSTSFERSPEVRNIMVTGGAGFM